MVEIPGAAFLMGSYGGDGLQEERPAHERIVPTFWLDVTEVTVGAYRRCVEAGACAPTYPAKMCNFYPRQRRLGETDRESHPVNCVDLAMAEAYCDFVDKRLPSEAEWEFAASGGPEHRRYSWGEAPPSARNACYAHIGGTCRVGSFAPGAFGLYDMAGNVSEWTSSVFAYYPTGPAVPGTFVYRGGSWSRRFPHWLRATLRNRYKSYKRSSALGFRCAQSPPKVHCPAESAPEGGRCKRTSGTELCEPRRACPASPPRTSATTAHQKSALEGNKLHKRPPVASTEASVPARISATRTPSVDADCKAHYPGRPFGFRYAGGTFYSRNPVLAAAGCTRRFMGETWTSVCCPGDASP